jgi:uncharacterized Zn finger protein
LEKQYCVHCGENTAEIVEETADFEGVKYKDVYYKCPKCGEAFETLKQLGENMDRIREALKDAGRR